MVLTMFVMSGWLGIIRGQGGDVIVMPRGDVSVQMDNHSGDICAGSAGLRSETSKMRVEDGGGWDVLQCVPPLDGKKAMPRMIRYEQ